MKNLLFVVCLAAVALLCVAVIGHQHVQDQQKAAKSVEKLNYVSNDLNLPDDWAGPKPAVYPPYNMTAATIKDMNTVCNDDPSTIKILEVTDTVLTLKYGWRQTVTWLDLTELDVSKQKTQMEWFEANGIPMYMAAPHSRHVYMLPDNPNYKANASSP